MISRRPIIVPDAAIAVDSVARGLALRRQARPASPVPGDPATGIDPSARGLAAGTLRSVRLIERLQKLIAGALGDRRNPVNQSAWLAPPAYAPSTAYTPGQIVSNGGNWYVCGVAGTSPASGGGPTTTTSAGYVVDGAGPLAWSFYGGARSADAGDGAPSVSVVTANPNLGANWYPVAYPSSFRLRGATAAPYRTNFWDLISFQAKADGTIGAPGASVSCVTDESKLAIFIPANSYNRILVDGRYLTPSNLALSGSDIWLVIDWTATSGRRARAYEIETNKSATHVGYVQTSTRSSVWAPGTANEPRLVVIGDSYNAGNTYGPWLAGGAIAQLLAKRIGWRDCWNLSTGGTGYLNPNVSFYTYRQRVPQALALNPDAVMLMGSTNDASYTPAAVQAEVLATLQALRAGGFIGPIIVAGLPSINVTGAAATETAVAAAVTTFADPLCFFIPITGASPPWVLGSWNNGSGVPAGTANSAFYVAADNVHPPEIGYDYYAARIEQAIRASVIPKLQLAV